MSEHDLTHAIELQKRMANITAALAEVLEEAAGCKVDFALAVQCDGVGQVASNCGYAGALDLFKQTLRMAESGDIHKDVAKAKLAKIFGNKH